MQRPMRRLLTLLAAIAVVVAAASGISGAASTRHHATGGGGGGGTLRYGLEAEADGLNPTANRWAVAAYAMGQAVFDPLFRRGDDDTFHPYLLESATPNSDFTAWDLKLRPDITFHDGTPLTSEAIKVNLEASLADPLISIAINDFFDPDNPVEIVDDLTARVHMSGPNAHLPQYLVAQIGYIASPTWLAAAKADPDLDQEPVGTGPFKFESRVQDSTTTFVRNDDYWQGRPKLDGIEFVIQTDPARRADQLLAGELDMLHTSDPSAIELLRGEPDIKRYEQDTGEEAFVMINTQNAPFDDIRVRRALAAATPKKQYLEIIGRNIVTPANDMFHPSLTFHNPNVKQLADNSKLAKKLAAEYCTEVPANCEGDKIKMSFKYTGPSAALELTADVLIDGWQNAFVVEREQVLQDDYILQVATGDYQTVVWRQFGADDPDGDFVWMDCRNAGQPGSLSINWPRYCNEEMQSLLEADREQNDVDQQAETWHKVTKLINEGYAYIFLNHTPWLIATAGNVKNAVVAKQPDGKGKTVLGNGSHSLWQISLT
jgi:peptide/nickel transport system substrate-binding protein